MKCNGHAVIGFFICIYILENQKDFLRSLEKRINAHSFSKDKKANIFTMCERKSRFLVALKNNNRSPLTITQNLINSEISFYSKSNHNV